jgi:hypothetical protein
MCHPMTELAERRQVTAKVKAPAAPEAFAQPSTPRVDEFTWGRYFLVAGCYMPMMLGIGTLLWILAWALARLLRVQLE